MKYVKIQKILLLSMVFSSALFADILDRIEYKLNRVLRDIDTVVAGNAANCTPITQGEINEGSGTYTIVASGLYCVTEDVTGSIVIDADCVSIDLESHTVSADGAATAISVDGHEGIRIFNGCISNASDAGVLVVDSTAVELFGLHMHDHANDAIRVNGSDEVYVHNVDFIGGTTTRALGIEDSSSIVVENCEMNGYTSDGQGILEIIASDCVAVRGVDVLDCVFSGDTPAAGIHVGDSADVVIKYSNSHRMSTSTEVLTHGIWVDASENIHVIDSQANSNEASGFEVTGTSTNIAFIECVASGNTDSGFEFNVDATPVCCLVQDCRAIGNTVWGFAHLPGLLETTFIGNEAQCNGDDDYNINGGEISLQVLSWVDGTMTVIDGNAALGARFTNITSSAFNP